MGRLKKVYAYQIKENKKYKGRYIILIKQPKVEEDSYSNLYKVKLTNDMKLPKTVEEINSCEFVKMRVCPYELRMFPIMGGLNYDEALQNYKDTTLPDSDNNQYYAKPNENMIAKIESITKENNKLIITTTGDSTEYCLKTTKSVPSIDSLCWNKIENNKVESNYFTYKKYYLWIKDSDNRISGRTTIEKE